MARGKRLTHKGRNRAQTEVPCAPRQANPLPTFEWELYRRTDGNLYPRLVLPPNVYDQRGQPPSERTAYGGGDFWTEDVWRQIERLLRAPDPDEDLRDRLRQAVFAYVQETTPAGRTRFIWHEDAEWVETVEEPPDANRIISVRWTKVSEQLGAIARAATGAAKLPELLSPVFDADTQERGERDRALSLLANAAEGLIPVLGEPTMKRGDGKGTRFANGLHRSFVPALEELRPTLRRVAEMATQVRHALEQERRGTTRRGRKGDPALDVLVAELVELLRQRRGDDAGVSTWDDDRHGDRGGYSGDLYELASVIAPHLPRVPGTIATRTPMGLGEALKRAKGKVNLSLVLACRRLGGRTRV